ncbi:YhcH/YjgK/YiaL family protein [Oribacterium sp. WCC10]|uniref:YhcH/YjgK/YiaL family protein n=1 Tax=Oribacterium sp. WCC10 TaxID=1855343 RepID=UPI0008E1C63F|nr:YhcH/YjgK/YiaL family protein [Oribacterium sp. WCC10]SFG13105.1 YhcH/YjgK/YiaL family protein [Oribacterium sp. WCC10]
MIVDDFSHIRFYEAMLPNLEAGLQAIEEEKAKGELKEGSYRFEGGFFKVQKGVTKPFSEGTFEGHKKYIDVQIILDGSEEIAWKELKELKEVIPYDEEKDMARYEGSFEHQIMINKGMFWAAFPHDGHKAISHSKEQQSFTKIILKLPV